MAGGPSWLHLGGLRVASICTLSTAGAEDRQAALNGQLAAHNLSTRYIFGPVTGSPAGATAGWIHMLRACRAYPALLTEDDADVAARFDASRLPPLPADETLLSLGSGNCASPDCSTPSWVAPHTRRPYTFGVAVLYVPSRAVADRAIAWVTGPYRGAGRPPPTIDGRLFVGGFGVMILCPPLFGWQPGHSVVNRRMVRGRRGFGLGPLGARPCSAPHDANENNNRSAFNQEVEEMTKRGSRF